MGPLECNHHYCNVWHGNPKGGTQHRKHNTTGIYYDHYKLHKSQAIYTAWPFCRLWSYIVQTKEITHAGTRGCFGLRGGKFSKFLASKRHTRRKFLATDVHLLWGTSVCVPQSPKWGRKVGLNSFFANLWRRKRQPSWLLTTFTTSVFCPVFSSSKLKAERVSGGVVFLATNRLGHSCLCPGVSPRQKIDVIFLALCR